MMFLSELTNNLKGKFNLDNSVYAVSDRVNCFTFEFSSDFSFRYSDEDKRLKICMADEDELDDGEIENKTFRYAVFAPSNVQNFGHAIILLHGLNERKWEKYLPWAHHLVMQTGKPVILFPIAYHMNRSPKTWTSPRLMSKFASFRKNMIPSLEDSSFANVAISFRMDNFPEFFSIYGIQTYFDVIKLASQIKEGVFDLFDKNCKINFFAYSIGALLTETLLMSNPKQLFSTSKAFFFCGGSTFDRINGVSRSIMDSQAFNQLQSYVTKQPPLSKEKIEVPEQQHFLLPEGWKAFMAMSNFKGKLAAYRNKALKRLRKRINAIGLKDDSVIPGTAIRETLSGVRKKRRANVDIIDFPFQYSHEMPFPVNNSKIEEIVSHAFHSVFRKAAMFLS
ncbi:MAG: DUF6051 family protein [Cytophagaceae bacterium]|nr:DUF6051 family protein [Cytophagaceae bacterium]